MSKKYIRIGKKKRAAVGWKGGFSPPLKFLVPAYNPLWGRIWRFLIPLFVQRVNRVKRCHLENGEGLVKALQEFYQGKSRLIIAFRHPSLDDPPVIYKVVVRDLVKLARKLGKPFPVPPHLFFMYSRGLPLWAGKYLEWLLPRLGATPIFRGQTDRAGIASALKLLVEGKHPLAVAPEGTINTKNWEVKTLETGLVKIALMGQKALKEKGLALPVVILPVGIAYLYPKPPWNELDELLEELEAGWVTGTGFDLNSGEVAENCRAFELPTGGKWPSNPALKQRYERFLQIYLAMLGTLEETYRHNYNKEMAPAGASPDERASWLVERILELAEERLLIKGSGRTIKRIQKVEQLAWNHQYRLTPNNPAKGGFAHWLARESSLSALHTWIVYGLYDIKLTYLFEDPSFERVTEMALLTWDILSTCLGIKALARPILGPREAKVTVGQPLVIPPLREKGVSKEKSPGGQGASYENLSRGLEQELYRLTTLAKPG